MVHALASNSLAQLQKATHQGRQLHVFDMLHFWLPSYYHTSHTSASRNLATIEVMYTSFSTPTAYHLIHLVPATFAPCTVFRCICFQDSSFGQLFVPLNLFLGKVHTVELDRPVDRPSSLINRDSLRPRSFELLYSCNVIDDRPIDNKRAKLYQERALFSCGYFIVNSISGWRTRRTSCLSVFQARKQGGQYTHIQ